MEQAQDAIEPVGRIAPALPTPAIGSAGEGGERRRAPRRAPRPGAAPVLPTSPAAPRDVAPEARPVRGGRIDERA